MKEKKHGRDMSLKGQIGRNNQIIIYIIIVTVLLMMVNLLLIDWYQNRLRNFNLQANDVKEVELDQYIWLNDLENDVSVEMDADKCSFAVWYTSRGTLKESEVSSELKTAYDAHKQMHEIGRNILNADEAGIKEYSDQLSAKAQEMLTALNAVHSQYSEEAAINQKNLLSRIIWAIMTNIVLAIAAVVIAKKTGNRLSAKISKPISAVADWSRELSMGATDLSFDMTEATETDLTEVKTMIDSFQKMAESIEENVRVVQKVADGDMTAFVNIRSASDSLGHNLYRMVQSNDLMFAEISGIADSVAEGADHISKASGALAESCSVQAGAVKDFSGVITETGVFISQNNEKAQGALKVSDEIQDEINESTSKMNQLLESMEAIRAASEKVSAIIKTIDDIAGQTNMLALNAAIEAARAGEAGKGFAVVADEVKDLAAKSSEAADESRQLIEDTLQKTILGDQISQETSATFTKITESINGIIKIINDIAEAGDKQQEHIAGVQENIRQIAEAIDGNAAASEEAAAASDELNHSADDLKEAMRNFNLRKRTPGKPYIPPEKADDPKFIQIAEQNYLKAKAEGKAAL